eukprot:scaffold4611_cov130-Skeletonema_dohrnii-CCMP3373.AAC.1
MKRPNRKITYFTDTPKSTGKRKREGVDKDDEYDIDIGEFFANMNDEGLQASASEPRPLADTDLRSHGKIMKRANVRACSAIKTHVDDNASVLANAEACSNNKPSAPASTSNSQQTQNNTNASNHQQQQSASCTFNVRYEDILTFIQGTLLVGSNGEGDVDVDVDGDMDDGDGEESGSGSGTGTSGPKIPTLYEIARGES